MPKQHISPAYKKYKLSRRTGFVIITRPGSLALEKKPARIDGDFLSQYEEFRAFQNKKKDKPDKPSADSVDDLTPIESIDSQYRRLREALATEIIEKVKACSAEFFERLVITLLVKMGYGGSLKEAGSVVGRSGDGGIDGVIKEDKLGLDSIYVQAKRWTGSSVGSPQIDQFAGALQKKKASKGIFMTTSTFSNEAKASIKDYPVTIVLLEGTEIAQLMIDYNVGVSINQTYEIKKMESDFFEGEVE